MIFNNGFGSYKIEICGGIASGKTTLANLLASSGIRVVLEDFTNNPFWQAFYADPIGTAFETEITFLLQHYHQIKVTSEREKCFACDFSLLLDHAYANVTLDGTRLDTFKRVYNEACSHLPPPSLLVFLQCSPEVELERIEARGRSVEKNITIGYLNSVNASLTSLVSALPETRNILYLDSENDDFAHDQNTKASILKQILDRLNCVN